METGTASGYFTGGHLHVTQDPYSNSSVEAQHNNGTGQLQGIFIEKADGSAFSLSSLDYRVRSNYTFLPGYSNFDSHILLATEFDPTQSIASQFTGYSVGAASTTWSTLNLSGFDNVTRVYLASSTSVSFDNISTPEYRVRNPGPHLPCGYLPWVSVLRWE